jgi:HK97 family phage major capsid protein
MQIAKLERNAFLNGNGNTAPVGILNDARLTNNLNFEGRENDDEVWRKLLDKILDMIHALPNEYKQNACFMMSSYIKNQLDKIKDRDQRYMNFDGKKTLFNYEVHIIDELRQNGNSLDEDEESEVDFSSQGKKPGKKAKFSDNILFGNFKYAHLICDGDSSDITTHDLFDKPNSIGLSMPTNCGAGIVCPEALVRLRINIS